MLHSGKAASSACRCSSQLWDASSDPSNAGPGHGVTSFSCLVVSSILLAIPSPESPSSAQHLWGHSSLFELAALENMNDFRDLDSLRTTCFSSRKMQKLKGKHNFSCNLVSRTSIYWKNIRFQSIDDKIKRIVSAALETSCFFSQEAECP